MSEITFFQIFESADFFWPSSSTRTSALVQNARAATGFIRRELLGLLAPANATIRTDSTPMIRQMETRLSERSARLTAAPPVIRQVGQQLARAEQTAIRMSSLKVAHTLPQLLTATARIYRASQDADDATRRGEIAEAERHAREAAEAGAALERDVEAAARAQMEAAGLAGDALARAAGLFTGLMADPVLSGWAATYRTETVQSISLLIRDAQAAYVDAQYTLATARAQEIQAKAVTLTDQAERAVSQLQLEANVRAATSTLIEMGFSAKTTTQPDGTVKVAAKDRGRAVLDMTFNAAGQVDIDSHTHKAFQGAACSVTVGRFLAAYRERVHFEDVSRVLVGAGADAPGLAVGKATRTTHRQLSAQGILAEANRPGNGARPGPPKAVLAVWAHLKQ